MILGRAAKNTGKEDSALLGSNMSALPGIGTRPAPSFECAFVAGFGRMMAAGMTYPAYVSFLHSIRTASKVLTHKAKILAAGETISAPELSA